MTKNEICTAVLSELGAQPRAAVDIARWLRLRREEVYQALATLEADGRAGMKTMTGRVKGWVRGRP